MTNQEFKNLARKYEDGSATQAERDMFEKAYDSLSHQYLEWDDHVMNAEEAVKGEIFYSLINNIEQFQKKKKRLIIYKYIGVAASILMITGAAFYINRPEAKKQSVSSLTNDVAPGSNKAFLILSNGKRIELNNLPVGEIVKQSGVVITKTGDGKLVYTIDKSAGHVQNNEYNVIETPKGGQYQVRLPDGTFVWINSSSVLKYPVTFVSLKEREVGLIGEAYFEVAKDAAHAFIVGTDKQKVVVLGTHFNINAYTDEPSVKTTLLEGSVKIKGIKGIGKTLKPGQQATLSNQGQLDVLDVDTEIAVAWKNKQFMFESERIETIMRMIERWYDVEVIYKGEKTDERFGGGVSRFDKVSKVLKSLESTGNVHFKIQGRKIYVSK